MRMKSAREHALKQFTVHVQTQTCIVFFPHTINYVLVEKPPEEGVMQNEEPPESVMEERMVCELARVCALNYQELITIEAKEVQLTEDTLNEVNGSVFFFKYPYTSKKSFCNITQGWIGIKRQCKKCTTRMYYTVKYVFYIIYLFYFYQISGTK